MYGFDAVGVARADEPLTLDHARYEQFVAAGMHGEMGYLAENSDARMRLDTPLMLEGARSVVCLARKYRRAVCAERGPLRARPGLSQSCASQVATASGLYAPHGE